MRFSLIDRITDLQPGQSITFITPRQQLGRSHPNRGSIGAISRQAVYDSLGMLVKKGLIRRIQPAGSPTLYENRIGDNHHHLICRGCGKTVDVDCATGHAPCLTAIHDSGFQIDEAEVIYWGACPDCLSAK